MANSEFGIAVNEHDILFFQNGGHTHNGSDSSQIVIPNGSVGLSALTPDLVGYITGNPLSNSAISAGGSVTVNVPGPIAPGGDITGTQGFAASAIISSTSVSFTGTSTVDISFYRTNDFADSDIEYHSTGCVSGFRDGVVWGHTDASGGTNLYYRIHNSGSSTVSNISIELVLGTALAPSDVPTVNGIGLLGDVQPDAIGDIRLASGVGVGIVRSGNTFIFSTAPINNPTGTPPVIIGVTSFAGTTGIDQATGNPYINLTWDYGTTVGVSFNLQLNQDGFGTVKTFVTNNLSASFTDLIPGQLYHIYIQVVSTSGQYSNQQSINITAATDTTVPAQVTGLTVNAAFKSVVCTWSAVTSYPIAASYNVELATDTGFTANTQTVNVQGNIQVFTGMTAGTTYYVRVQAVTGSNVAGPWSATVSASTLTTTATDIGPNSITTGAIIAGAITADSGILATASVGTATIQDAAITDAKITNLTVSKLTSGSLQTAFIDLGTGLLRTSQQYSSGVWATLLLDSNGLHMYTGQSAQNGTSGTPAIDINAATGGATFSGTLESTYSSSLHITGGDINIGPGKFMVASDGTMSVSSGSIMLQNDFYFLNTVGNKMFEIQWATGGDSLLMLGDGSNVGSGIKWSHQYAQYQFIPSGNDPSWFFGSGGNIDINGNTLYLAANAAGLNDSVKFIPNGTSTATYNGYTGGGSAFYGALLSSGGYCALGDGTLGIYLKTGSGTIDMFAPTTVHDAFYANSKAFKIEHPVDSTKWLIYNSIEGPKADVIHRGTVTLSNGTATVNIDTATGLLAGTFAALTQNVQAFLQNETGTNAASYTYDGSGNLKITCADQAATIGWMVIAERNDKDVHNMPSFKDGHLINEVPV